MSDAHASFLRGSEWFGRLLNFHLFSIGWSALFVPVHSPAFGLFQGGENRSMAIRVLLASECS